VTNENKYIETTKQLAALKQLHAVIWLFQKDEFECAITLAAAAEGLLPPVEGAHLFQALKSSKEVKETNYNLFINWLKHPNITIPGCEIDSALIPEFEVVIIIVRAISKFRAVYKTGSPVMADFIKWAFENGHLPTPKVEEK
jgi:hypothetical protein